jgi:hypothetical protein
MLAYRRSKLALIGDTLEGARHELTTPVRNRFERGGGRFLRS